MTTEEGQAFADRMGTLFMGEALSASISTDLAQSAPPRRELVLTTPSRNLCDE